MSCRTDEMKRNIKKFGEKIWNKTKAVGTWVMENPGETCMIVLGVATVGLSVAGIDLAWKEYENEIEDLNRVTDPELGLIGTLKRSLTGEELSEISYRVATGERTFEVLEEMNLLK